MAEQASQLVFGGDDGDLCACIVEGLEDCACTEQFGIVHHYLFTSLRIQEEVTGNAMYLRGHACDNGEVVGISEAWHHAIAPQIGSTAQYLLHERHLAAGHCFLNILRL